MLIPNLTKDDFEVLEDGKPQTIKYFSAESNQPLTLGIMIDTSASQTRVLDHRADVLRRIPACRCCGDKDLAFVINFDVDVDLDQDFTNNVHDLTARLIRCRSMPVWVAARQDWVAVQFRPRRGARCCMTPSISALTRS